MAPTSSLRDPMPSSENDPRPRNVFQICTAWRYPSRRMHASHPEAPPKTKPAVSVSLYSRYTPGASTASAIVDTPLTKKCTTLAVALTATATCVHTSTSTTVADAMLAHSPAVCDDTNATEPFACAPQHPTPVPPHASITAQPDSPCETIICVLLTLDVLIQASTVSSPVALTACLNSLLSSVLYTDMAVSAEKSSDIAVWSFRYIKIGGSPSGSRGNTMSPVDVDVAEFLTRNSTATPSWVSTISASAASYRAIGAWSGW